MKATTAKVVTVELDEVDATAVAGFLTRALRITDDLYSCPIPEGECSAGRELRDALAAALEHRQNPRDLFPPTPLEMSLVGVMNTAIQSAPR